MSEVTRRDFLNGLFHLSNRKSRVTAGLDEYTAPLSREEVKHLLSRTTFATSPWVIDKYVGKTAGQIVDTLFANAHAKKNPTPPSFVNDKLYNPGNYNGTRQQDEQRKLDLHSGQYNYDLGGWWVSQMKNDQESILEKLTFFWHGHLTTQYSNCVAIPVIPMYLQNDMFRKNFAGNFYTLLENITIDGAMLVYLNGRENINEAPNENYARELLELYSLGVGNYTENDIKQAAKILTGWKVSYFSDETTTPNKGYLEPKHFDKNSKLFFEEIFNVDYEITQENVFKNSVKKLISVILSKKGNIAAKFMMTKMYRYFVYSNPDKTDEGIVNQLAQMLIENKFEFEPVLKKLLKSQHFFDPNHMGIQLKSPADTIVNMIAHLNYVDLYARNVMAILGLELFNPPNVSGWKGYRSWVSTKSVPTTAFYLHEIFSYNTPAQIADWADKIDPTSDWERLTSRIMETFLGKRISDARFQYFRNFLATSADEWNSTKVNKTQKGNKVKALMVEIIKAPEFYLS